MRKGCGVPVVSASVLAHACSMTRPHTDELAGGMGLQLSLACGLLGERLLLSGRRYKTQDFYKLSVGLRRGL